MAKFTQVTSHVVPLAIDHIDTDQIIPARFLKVTSRDGLGKSAFCDWRYEEDGSPKPDFPLNRPSSQGAKVLLAGENFGCGSSREHAPWALRDWGLEVIIARSFADIFQNNALKNGLLPVQVDLATHTALASLIENDVTTKVSVNLDTLTLNYGDGKSVGFSVDSFSRHCLLEGVDQLGYILSFGDKITAYEESRTSF